MRSRAAFRAMIAGVGAIATLLGGCASGPADGGREMEFRGATLRYTDRHGAGARADTPAVVFIHGWASARWFWDAQMAGLGAERRLIAIDLPGYGESEDVADEHSFDLYADAIVAVLDTAGVERAVLVGHSNGVATVRQVWRRHPERAAGLVAVDGALRAFFEHPSEWEAFYEPLRGPEHREWTERFVGQLTDEMPDPALAARVRETILDTPLRVRLGGFGAITKPGVWEEDRIGVPLLVINAAAPYWDDEMKAFVRALSDDAEYIEWAGVSHMLMMDRPDEFNAALLDWLDRHGF